MEAELLTLRRQIAIDQHTVAFGHLLNRIVQLRRKAVIARDEVAIIRAHQVAEETAENWWKGVKHLQALES